MWTTKGFEKQKKLFETAARSGSLAHAYIFSGQDMLGKRMFARDFFYIANNRAVGDHEPDLIEITAPAGGTISIESIRDLKTTLGLSPYRGPYRFVIIDDAHHMTTEAANALLKALEEPAASTVFFLVTSQPELLPQTISSRGQSIQFLPHLSKIVSDTLSEFKLSSADQTLITQIANGRLGWAIQTAQPDNLKNLKKAIADFSSLLKKPLADRMLYAKTLYEKELYLQYVPYWLHWTYSQKTLLPNASHVLGRLLTLQAHLTQAQYNHRLLLENTLINL